MTLAFLGCQFIATMSASLLLKILNNEAYESLSAEVKNVLEDHLALKDNAINNLEGEIQKIKADYGKFKDFIY